MEWIYVLGNWKDDPPPANKYPSLDSAALAGMSARNSASLFQNAEFQSDGCHHKMATESKW